MRIHKTMILYCFYVNLALLFRSFVQPYFFLNFLAFLILVFCIVTSLLMRVCIAQNLMVVRLFFIRYVLILCATFSKVFFFISFAETFLLSFTIILFYLLQNKKYSCGQDVLNATAIQVCVLEKVNIVTHYFLKTISLLFMLL